MTMPTVNELISLGLPPELSKKVFDLRHSTSRTGASSSHTGDTSETTLATIAIPAGALGSTGALRITTIWSVTDNANNKTLRVRFGASGASTTHAGTAFLAATYTTIAAYADVRVILNRASVSSQIGMAADAVGGLGSSSSALVTSAINTNAETEIEISGELGDSSDTITLEAYIVEILPS